jgi:hypothetical protein
LVAALAIAILFVVGGTSASPQEVAVSLGLVAGIGMSAGWLAGPLAARQPRRVLVPAVGYAIAVLATNGILSMLQAAWDAWIANGLDPLAIGSAIAARALLALVSTAYLLLPAVVIGLAWSLTVRQLARFGGAKRGGQGLGDGGDRAASDGSITDVDPAAPRAPRDPRRLAFAAAGIIAGYAVIVAAVSAGLIGGLGANDRLAPPEEVPRPLMLAGLFLIPAAVAAIGAIRRSRPLLVAAGFICLGQATIAFSGVTIPFAIPAIVLVALGLEASGIANSRREIIGGIAVVVLGLAALTAPFALSETRCWIARTGADGAVVYFRAPVSNTMTLGVGEVAGGCDGGALTVQGAALGAIFGIGAVAIAALVSTAPTHRREPGPLDPSVPRAPV